MKNGLGGSMSVLALFFLYFGKWGAKGGYCTNKGFETKGPFIPISLFIVFERAKWVDTTCYK